jgi:hypothetical protein
MATSVQVSTLTHSTTFVANNLLRSIKQLVVGSGLTADTLAGDWAVLERGIAAWLESRHLNTLTLEVFKAGTSTPTGLLGRFDFNIDYGYYPGGDGDLWLDSAAVAFAIKKAGTYPSLCQYRVLASCAEGRAVVNGWSDTTYRSAAGFTQQSMGTSIGGGSLGAGLSVYRKNT